MFWQRGLSPEQICGRLRAEQGGTVVDHETIYRFVYESPRGRQEKLYQCLRRGKKKRTRRQGRRGHASPIAGRLFIDARPPAANQRTEIDHWESDSLLFGHDQALNVLVDRLSRFTVVTRLRGKTAQDTHYVLMDRLSLVSKELPIPFFFCHPYHSWEKGTAENTSGLIRCYLPRETDLNHVPQDDLNAIAAELNHRPRIRLGFRTPYEVLSNVCVALSYWIHAAHPIRIRQQPRSHRHRNQCRETSRRRPSGLRVLPKTFIAAGCRAESESPDRPSSLDWEESVSRPRAELPPVSRSEFPASLVAFRPS